MRLLGNCQDLALWGQGRDLESLVQIQPVLPHGCPVCPHYGSASSLVSPGWFGTRAVPLAAPIFLPSPLPALWQCVPHRLIAYFQLATFSHVVT